MAFKSDFDENASPYKNIWKLSWPQVVMMFFHFWVGFADVYVAGKIDRDVQASLGLITSCLFFMLIIAVATANGAVAAISQSVGAGLYKRVQRYVGLCLELGLGLGVLLFLAGSAFRRPLLALLQVPPEIEGVTDYFFGVYLMVLPSYYLLVITNAIFRARKEVLVPLATMILITVVNTVGDFALGLGMWGAPDMGYRGLAWATFFSVTAGMCLNVFVLYKKGLVRRESFPPWRWVRKALAYLFKVAWPAGLMQILWQTGYLVLYAIVASLPEGSVDAMAGFTVGLRIESILFLPGFAFNMTASVLVGHFLGAGRPDEAKRFGYRIWLTGLVLVGVCTLGVWQVARPIADFLSPEPAVQAQVMDYLFYNLIAIPFTLTSMILGGALLGAGASIYNTVIFGASVWLVRLPLAWTLGHVVLESSTGVWMAQMISQMVQAGLVLAVFQFGNWSRFAMIRRNRRPVPVPETVGCKTKNGVTHAGGI